MYVYVSARAMKTCVSYDVSATFQFKVIIFKLVQLRKMKKRVDEEEENEKIFVSEEKKRGVVCESVCLSTWSAFANIWKKKKHFSCYE